MFFFFRIMKKKKQINKLSRTKFYEHYSLFRELIKFLDEVARHFEFYVLEQIMFLSIFYK